MLSHHNTTETEIPRQIHASVLPTPISPLRMQRERASVFVWCGQQDLAQGGHAKPRWISALLRPSVTEAPQNSQAHSGEPRTRGSDSPPGCHSLPRPLKSFIRCPAKQTAYRKTVGFLFWNGRSISNRMPIFLKSIHGF